MIRCVEILGDSNVAGCPLPPRTKPREGVLKRQFHFQGVHSVEYTKGTKRDRPDATAGAKVPTAPYRRKRPMHESGPSESGRHSPLNNGILLHRRDRGNHQTSGLQFDPSGTKSRAEKDSEGVLPHGVTNTGCLGLAVRPCAHRVVFCI